MADVFAVGMASASSSGIKVDPSFVLEPWNDGVTPNEYAHHAIIAHDELVEEVERLRGAVRDAFIDGCQVGWDMTGEGYNAEYGGPDDGRLHEEFSAIFAERYSDS